MKKTRKIMAYLLVLAFVLAFMPKGIDRVYAADSKVVPIKASDYAGGQLIDTDSLKNFERGDTLQIQVNGDVKVGNIYVTGDLEVIGKGKLETGCIDISGDATFASGTTVSCKDNSWPMNVNGQLKIESGAKVISELTETEYHPAVRAYSADISGDLSIKSVGCGIGIYDSDASNDSENKLFICGGKIDIKCDFNGFYASGAIDIAGGDISIACKYDGIYSSGSVNISGGTVDINCSDYKSIYVKGAFEMTGGTVNVNVNNYAVSAYELIIKGGKLVSECTFEEIDYKYNVTAGNTINFGDGMYIEEPEGGKVTEKVDDDDEKLGLITTSSFYCIADTNDEVPNKIVIAPIPEPEPEPTPEPTPTPTPDPTTNYKNEWVDGKWYDANGKCTYDGILSWKQNETGWWVEDTKGWYPTSTWQKIDGKWYYFTADGYMDYSEYRDGYWLGDDGAWVEDYYGGHWMSDATGWWYEDASGWYPVSRWLWIDGSCYYFESSGYIAVSKYVDGCWVGADGAWVK